MDVEDARLQQAVDGNLVFSRSDDRDRLANIQLTPGQADGLAGKAGIELDRVVTSEVVDGITERAGISRVVGGVRDVKCGEHQAIFEALESMSETSCALGGSTAAAAAIGPRSARRRFEQLVDPRVDRHGI